MAHVKNNVVMKSLSGKLDQVVFKTCAYGTLVKPPARHEHGETEQSTKECEYRF